MIFIDTNFFIGFFIKNDFWFERASEIIKEIPSEERIICQAVLNEIITLLGMKSDVETCKKVYNYLKDTCTIFNENSIPNINDKIMETYMTFNGDLSFTDSTIIESMKELGITKIITFDKDFDKVNGIQRIY
jgi:predicted nucleic acid-binding protein